MTVILRPTLEETRDLVRTALTEAFPGIAFTLAIEDEKIYGDPYWQVGGDLPGDIPFKLMTMLVARWIDGPNWSQASTILDLFQRRGKQPSEKAALLDGKPIEFPCIVVFERSYSDDTVTTTTEAMVRRRWRTHTVPTPYEVNSAMGGRSFVKKRRSPTAARIALVEQEEFEQIVEAEALRAAMQEESVEPQGMARRRRL
ncbi:hypothetical protein [Burkholderia anthina]|uniref:hypothetical protein n=1 Tax=Burkholderia anthina TaxID=179879 RepID=UPI0037BE4FB1